jgi:cell division septation protein DedD
VRVEGFALIGLGAALVAALAGAFYLGILVGRSGSPAPAAAAGSENGGEDLASAPPAASYFDTVGAGGRAAEPDRQASPPPARVPVPAQTAASSGKWVVQVFAGRDRRAAESLLRTLTQRGYPVKIDSRKEGRETLFKVRVGGYPTEDAARAAADRLRKDGESGAWVTRLP